MNLRKIGKWTGLVAAVVLSWTVRADAALKLPAVFGDGMVLQRGIPLPVWGWADPGENVTVSFLGQSKSAAADKDGKWMVKLDPVKAGGPFEMTVSAKESKTLKNVLVGEVWVCSGQSNMEWSLRNSHDGQQFAIESKNPNLRLFTVQKKPSDTPLSDVTGKWSECDADSAINFSAVGYHFGKRLQESLGVPVGLIHTSWGGTSIYLWMREDVMAADPQLKPMIESHPARVEQYKKAQAAYASAMEKYKADAEAAKKEGKPAPQAPRNPGGMPMGPASLYNGMLAPIVPYGIGGAIWYQGESNAGQAMMYRRHLPAMIKNWRDDFGHGEFPFLVVQLANFMERKDQPTDTPWAELREAQLMATQSVPKTGMAVAIDIGEAKDIHPRDKRNVGVRLALAAEAIAYGKDVVHSGPVYDSMKIEGDKAVLKFKHTGGGLVADGGALQGFAIAGADKKFVWADAKIEGDGVVVSSKEVPNPVAVRYAWADNPECNLYNKERLPASPFRTDDWPRQGGR